MLSARQLQLLGPQAAVTEAHTPRASAPQQEEPVQWNAYNWRVDPALWNKRKPEDSNERPSTNKNKTNK